MGRHYSGRGRSSLVIHFGSLSSVHVCVSVVESVRYYYLAVSHYTARVYCTSWHEAMRRTPPTLARVSSESPANLAGVSSESLTTLARVSSARSRSPCEHGDCSLLLPSGEPLAIRHTSVQHSRTGQGGWVSILQVPSCLPPARRRPRGCGLHPRLQPLGPGARSAPPPGVYVACDFLTPRLALP